MHQSKPVVGGGAVQSTLLAASLPNCVLASTRGDPSPAPSQLRPTRHLAHAANPWPPRPHREHVLVQGDLGLGVDAQRAGVRVLHDGRLVSAERQERVKAGQALVALGTRRAKARVLERLGQPTREGARRRRKVVSLPLLAR